MRAEPHRPRAGTFPITLTSTTNLRARAFAAGKREYRGRTYHFYTKESLQEFEKAPAKYIETSE